MRAALLVTGVLLLLSAGPPSGYGQAADDSTYTVEAGDTLYDLARRFGVSVRALMNWNDLGTTALEEGQTLRVRPPRRDTSTDTQPPDADPPSDAQPDTATPPRNQATVPPDTVPRFGRHVVEEGESFVSLALRLGTTADSLFALNDSTTAPLSPGDTIRLPPRYAPPTHLVESGETLYSIAGEYGVSVRTLQAENDLDTTAIEPGQRLHLPERLAASVPPPGEWAAPDSTGPATVFPAPFAGRLTASGTPYNPDEFVISHPSLPYGSVVLLSTSEPTNHVFARVVERGPPDEQTLLEISEAVAELLGHDSNGPLTVDLRIVWSEDEAD